ncbi:MaoC domain protein dehydratase [Shewanella halifaxensis HAW-EB4]|uniref:MaoC domain protein dehydratase n=1 Tax=Shewanella halifaxensis (strain HAW-EB4) TaxID=458817 RepID=B0TTV3_SHEHH|nr:MaoC family dehydratase [Shewanella halifaxensis]ABZ76671.1 MaoC domain protein dehydratase [Shewanella halifaxensis HAW-EB4]
MKTTNTKNSAASNFSNIKLGEKLPELTVPITVALITSGAIATRDFFPGHHDKDAAKELGSPHIFMNILTTNALVQGFVEKWGGSNIRFTNLNIKLGMPNYPGDTMVFTGEVSMLDPNNQSAVVSLVGKNSMGAHVSGTVSITWPRDFVQ